MRLTGKTRQQLLLQNIIYYTLLLSIAGLTAWLSIRYSVEADWSANNRNSLTETSIKITEQLEGPVEFTAFIGDEKALHEGISKLIKRYQRIKPDINLKFVNPQTDPAKAREMGITRMGEMMVEYRNRRERIDNLTEETFTTALQKLARGQARWVVYINGHSERDPYSQDNPGYSIFTERLGQKGFNVQSLNLVSEQVIPDNTEILVIAGPRSNYLPGEIKLIQEYLEKGGNLLWLTDPESDGGLAELGKQLGISRMPGTVIDTAGQLFGVERPDFVLIVNNNNPEVLGEGFSEFSFYPQAVALKHSEETSALGLKSSPLLQTIDKSWNEIGPIQEDAEVKLDLDQGEQRGPLDIGLSLQRQLSTEVDEHGDADRSSPSTQRVVVVGDSDFLANAFIGNGGNALVGENIMNWLSHDDSLVTVAPIGAPDIQLNVSETYVVALAVLFMLVIPLSLIGAGIFIWLKRRKR